MLEYQNAKIFFCKGLHCKLIRSFCYQEVKNTVQWTYVQNEKQKN